MADVYLTLSAAHMGDVTAADFDAWHVYVSERIDARTGLDVSTFSARFGEAGDDVIVCADGDVRGRVRETVAALWEEFCADASAWPQSAIDRDAPAACRAYSVDGEGAYALKIMLDDNDFDHEEEERLLALQVGESTEYGGGAWALIVVKRVS